MVRMIGVEDHMLVSCMTCIIQLERLKLEALHAQDSGHDFKSGIIISWATGSMAEIEFRFPQR